MPTSLLDPVCNSESRTSAAYLHAERNLNANQEALGETQLDLVEHLPTSPGRLEWIYGRDGYLTAREHGRWWSGCSLPLRAARRMLQSMEVPTTVACLLNPAHGAQVRVVLDMLQRPQAIIALVPDLRAFQILLSCDDFSRELRRHRLWFAAGEHWQELLDRLLEKNPGLPTPGQFIRPLAADSTLTDSLVAPAQSIFNSHNAKRTALVKQESARWLRQGTGRICVVAPSHFRLWDDAGLVLAEVFQREDARERVNALLLDPDDPASASPVALARALRGCDAMVAANIGRSDLPEIVPQQMAWITWVTNGHIPRSQTRAPRDRLLLSSAELLTSAVDCGWPAECVEMAQWPAVSYDSQGARTLRTPGPRAHLVMLANTRPLNPPERISEYSSHAVLWEAIADELLENPFAVDDLRIYLDSRRTQMQIPEENFDERLFIEGLVIPAFGQGICRILMKAGLPVRCAGKGWSDLDEFRSVSGGPIESRAKLLETIASAAAIICPVPSDASHPVDAMGCPVLRSRGMKQDFIQNVRAALAGRLPMPSAPTNPLTAELIIRIAAMA